MERGREESRKFNIKSNAHFSSYLCTRARTVLSRISYYRASLLRRFFSSNLEKRKLWVKTFRVEKVKNWTHGKGPHQTSRARARLKRGKKNGASTAERERERERETTEAGASRRLGIKRHHAFQTPSRCCSSRAPRRARQRRYE